MSTFPGENIRKPGWKAGHVLQKQEEAPILLCVLLQNDDLPPICGRKWGKPWDFGVSTRFFRKTKIERWNISQAWWKSWEWLVMSERELSAVWDTILWYLKHVKTPSTTAVAHLLVTQYQRHLQRPSVGSGSISRTASSKWPQRGRLSHLSQQP